MDSNFSQEDFNAYLQQMMSGQPQQQEQGFENPPEEIMEDEEEMDYNEGMGDIDPELLNYLSQSGIGYGQPYEQTYNPSSISDDEINRILDSIL